MKVVAQRVLQAKVEVLGETVGVIKHGLLLLVAFTPSDTYRDLEWMAGKISRLRIFNDSEGVMNLSVKDVEGDILSVSQFTLYAKTKKGNRPSYVDSAPGQIAEPLYEEFNRLLSAELGKAVQTGRFGAEMQASLVNDGPVTIVIESGD